MLTVIEQITVQLNSLGIKLTDKQKHQSGEIKVVDDNFRLNQPFVGIPSFLRSSICTDIATLDTGIAVMGVPTDEGSPFMAGSRMGPRALREHSLRFGQGGAGYYDPENRKQYLEVEMSQGLITDLGDADIWPADIKRTFDNTTEMTRKAREGCDLLVVMGGDHAITYPVVRAIKDDIYVIHFDAHSDYAPFIHDLQFTNGHAFRHISPMPNVKNLIQAGIRSLRHSADMIEDPIVEGNDLVTMTQFRKMGPEGLAAMVPQGAKCYVSIDVDVLDISLVPGCVSAEPNGMTYAELRDTLDAIARHTEVIAFDFVEVNPQLDVGTGVTAYLGAHVMVEFLGRICEQPWWIEKRNKRLNQ
jgi:agmatinase